VRVREQRLLVNTLSWPLFWMFGLFGAAANTQVVVSKRKTGACSVVLYIFKINK
jgi:hypothetical protein